MVQGSAADMTKKAMVLLHKKGIIPHIQIHDELCLSVKDNMKDTVKNIMENAVPLEINNKVDFESGLDDAEEKTEPKQAQVTSQSEDDPF